MSAQTLQRRLGDLGTTYQGVLDDVRQRSARRLLANTDLGTGEIAFVLGFEEVNSFIRAFQVWEKTTPAKWRARPGAGRDEPQKPRRSTEAPRRAVRANERFRGVARRPDRDVG